MMCNLHRQLGSMCNLVRRGAGKRQTRSEMPRTKKTRGMVGYYLLFLPQPQLPSPHLRGPLRS